MKSKKINFEDFLATVHIENRDFIHNLHRDLMDNGCGIEIKEAKSGYVVSYLNQKKTLANYVFRKSGIFVRIYAKHINEYNDFLDSLPNEMQQSIQDAPVCKRLINPDACNSKCAMGYDFLLHGERLQKCRNGAFMFLLREESKPFIKAFLMNELRASA